MVSPFPPHHATRMLSGLMTMRLSLMSLSLGVQRFSMRTRLAPRTVDAIKRHTSDASFMTTSIITRKEAERLQRLIAAALEFYACRCDGGCDEEFVAGANRFAVQFSAAFPD